MIEVTSLVRGEIQASRRLSPPRERMEVSAAVLAVAAAGGVGLLLALGWTSRGGMVVKMGGFAAIWAVALVAALALAVGVVRGRARRFSIGAGMDADAFADRELDLVRRSGDGYELRLAPGMTGWIQGGRAPVPVDGMVSSGSVALRLADGGWAELRVGQSTFVARAVRDERPWSGLGRSWIRRIAPSLGMPLLAGAIGALVSAGPARTAITEADMRSAIPPRATPWEAEKILRRQAQLQSHTLHRCFDAMPLVCQRPGFIGIGVSLGKQGDIRSHWIARSTYGKDCPVDECMSDVVSTWIFDSLPEPMRVVLPVQVIRTSKPLPVAGEGLALLDGGP